MTIDGVKIIPQPDGKYTVRTEFGDQQNLTEAQARAVAQEAGMPIEEISVFFNPAPENPQTPAADKGKPNSVFANTGIENGGDKVKTRGEYLELKRRYREELYMEVHDKGGIEGYKHHHARIHARKLTRAQKAADRVMSSVYFTPDQKEEYKKQKKELEAQGKRPILLTEKDMELLHSPEFVLTDMDGNAIDLDGNVIGAEIAEQRDKLNADLEQKQTELEEAKNFAKLITEADKMSEAKFKELQDKVNAMTEGERNKPENAEAVALVGARGKKEENDAKIKSLEAETAQLQKDLESKEAELKEAQKKGAITAFNEDGTLNQEMVKLISATRIGTDNRLEMEERKAETEALTNKGEKQPTTKAGKWLKKKWDESPVGKHWHLRKAKRLYEHLGYSIQSDNTELYQAAIIAASTAAGAGAAAAYGSETVTVAGKVVTKVLGTFKYLTPVWVEEQVIEHTQHIPRPGGEDVVTWYDTIPAHYENVEQEGTLSISGKTPDKTETIVNTSVTEGALDGLAVGLVLAGLVDDSEKKNDIILHDMSPEEFVSKAWDDKDGKAYKKNIDLPRNRAMMEYVVNKAKALGMTQEELVAEIKRAQGTNDCLTEDELLKLAKGMGNPKRDPINPIELPENKPTDGPGKMARVEIKPEKYDVNVTSENTPYKMQKGETLANVIRAKYGITDPNDLKEAIREIRKATGIPENGFNANGTLAIPHIEVDGETLKDAYFLPPSLINGKYPLDMSKKVDTFDYSKRGEAAQGTSQTSTTAETRQRWRYTVTDPDGNVLYEGTDWVKANEARKDYNDKHINGPQAKLKKAEN